MALYVSHEAKIAGAATAGAVIGAVQTALLRQFVDIPMAENFLQNTSATPPVLMKQLKGFGSISSLAGIGAGIVGLALGLAILLKGAISRSVTVGSALIGYGSTALFTGLLSGLYPTAAWNAAVSADPNQPIGTASVKRASSSGIARQAPAPTLEA
jgi:hypothetical protein